MPETRVIQIFVMGSEICAIESIMAVLGHLRSLISVLIESVYATYY